MDARQRPESVVIDLKIETGDRSSAIEPEHQLAARGALGNIGCLELALVPQLAAAIGEPLRRFAQDRARQRRLVRSRGADREVRQNLSSPS
jgi:hypothetical protein